MTDTATVASPVAIVREGRIAVVTVDNPPVNALGRAVRQGLWDAVEALDADPSVDAVVLVCAGRTFIAGADVNEFGKAPEPPHLPDLVARIEAAAKPWTAAIHGSALGGGFEVALGCRFRVAVPTAVVGLPEVTLGVMPGAGGTVRLPRLVAPEVAVEIVTTGKPVKAPEALDLGLVDAVVTGDLRAEAIAFAGVRTPAAGADPGADAAGGGAGLLGRGREGRREAGEGRGGAAPGAREPAQGDRGRFRDGDGLRARGLPRAPRLARGGGAARRLLRRARRAAATGAEGRRAGEGRDGRGHRRRNHGCRHRRRAARRRDRGDAGRARRSGAGLAGSATCAASSRVRSSAGGSPRRPRRSGSAGSPGRPTMPPSPTWTWWSRRSSRTSPSSARSSRRWGRRAAPTRSSRPTPPISTRGRSRKGCRGRGGSSGCTSSARPTS